MATNNIKIAISQGDINGIGYEIIIKALSDNRLLDLCTPIIYGSPKVASYHRKAINAHNFSSITIKDESEANRKKVNIINCVDDAIKVELGKSTEEAGKGSFLALEKATESVFNKTTDVLVTCPINKHNIQSADFTFPGHTEYLSQKDNNTEPVMLMVSPQMKIGVATGHIPISEVSEQLTKELIIKKLRIINKSLIEDFAIRKPRIAVLGLNPHAGDNGLLGKEEQEIIIPAIEYAKEKGIMAFGPFPADGFFGSDSFSKFDAVLAMYHDQGLIPFKALAFDSGVNYTAGLSIIRTSPAHGTAYNLAGKNRASEESFRQAMYLAIDIFKNRQQYAEITKDPLKSMDPKNDPNSHVENNH